MAEHRHRFDELLSLRGNALVEALVEYLSELDRNVIDLQRELGALRDYQKAKQRWLNSDSLINSPAPLPRLVDVDATQLLPTRDGFFPVEYTSGGQAFRWTGPSSTFSFTVFIDRSAGAEMELQVQGFVDFEVQQPSLKLYVDQEPIPCSVEKKQEGFTVSASLPPTEPHQSTHLEFSVNTMKPAGDDNRSLGMSFTRLLIKSAQPAGQAADNRKPTDASVNERKHLNLSTAAE